MHMRMPSRSYAISVTLPVPLPTLTVYACLICDSDRPVVAIAACYVGSADRAEATVAPLRKWGTIVADQLRPMSYVELQSLFDAARPAGRRCAMRSNFMAALPDAAIEILVEGFRTTPSLLSALIVEHCHGAIARVAPDATAFVVAPRHGAFEPDPPARSLGESSAQPCQHSPTRPRSDPRPGAYPSRACRSGRGQDTVIGPAAPARRARPFAQIRVVCPLVTLADDFRLHGRQAIEKVRKTQPAASRGLRWPGVGIPPAAV